MKPATRALRPSSRSATVWAAVLSVAAVAGLGTGFGVARLTHRTPSRVAVLLPTPPSGAARQQPTPVSSVDPSGGSGFRHDGDVWATEHYATATFGNLKPGVGLLLDAGKPTLPRAVQVVVGTPGLTVSLRGLDAPPTPGRLGAQLARVDDARGTVDLRPGTSAPHRYWLVWVSRLAPDGGRWTARLGTPRLLT